MNSLIASTCPMAERALALRSRRTVLGSIALPLAVGLVGCTDESLEDAERLVVQNWHEDAHTVAITVLVDGTDRISRTVEVPEVTESGGRRTPGRATIEETIPGPGLLGETRYEVRVRLDGGDPLTEAKTTSEGFDDIEVRIDGDGSLDVAFMDAV